MHVFGLTGGIATGKSTVAAMFRERGVSVVDADQVAREVVEPGQPAFDELALRFPGVVGPDGRIDRAKLGARVFADPTERAALNAITHPRIAQRVLEHLDGLAKAGVPRVLYDAPLLIENNLHQGLQGVVLVAAPPEVQLARLMQRGQLDEVQARARIDSQLPLDQKRRHATWIIDNAGSRDATRQQVDAVLAAMRSMT
jgi:dephospho-CoA kinase